MSYIIWLGLGGGLAAGVLWGTPALLPGLLVGGLGGWMVALSDRVHLLERKLAQLTVERTEPHAQADATVDELPEQGDVTAQAKPNHKTAVEPPSVPSHLASSSVSGWESSTPLHEIELPDLPDAAPATAPSSSVSSSSSYWQSALQRFFTDGNLVVRLGLLVLFFGVAFLLKYAAEKSLLPLELRLGAAALGGIALAGTGWWLRTRRRGFALLLQGGGIGIFYLVLYGATALYGLLPPLLALVLMVVSIGLLVMLALWQDSQALAAFAISGGFLAPVLASSGSGSHVMLFSYYALLNLVVLALAWFRAWRPLNLLGFVFTFVIGTVWGVLQYRPEYYASTQPFLIYFFLIYVSVAVLFALRQPLQLRGYVDAGLVFGVPIVGFALQAALVRNIEYGMAFSALLMGAFYLSLARTLWRGEGEGMRLFSEAMLALGVIFLTLAIPLAFDGRWTAAAWALEGAAMVWIGLRQRRLSVRLFGLALMLLAGIGFLLGFGYPLAALPVLNSAALGAAMIALAGLFTAWQLQREPQYLHRLERPLHGWLLAWGLLWWLGGGMQEIARHVAVAHQNDASLLFIGASLAVLLVLWRRLPWPVLRWPLLATLALVWLMVLRGTSSAQVAWLYALGLLAWPFYLGVQYRLLWRLQDAVDGWVMRLSHGATLWLLLWVLSRDAGYWVGQWLGQGSAWQMAAIALPLLLALGLLPNMAARLHVGRWVANYQGELLIPVAAALGLWFLAAGTHAAGASPLPWLPLLNPLELSQLLTLSALALWLSQPVVGETWARLNLTPQTMWAVWGVLAFVLLNTVLAHGVHHWGGVAWQRQALFASGLLQTSLSVSWTLSALVLGWWATRRRWRDLWFVAAGLIGVVVLKLFVIDLADTGTIERIISFIAVGALMLLMGYVAPLPPRAANTTDSGANPEMQRESS